MEQSCGTVSRFVKTSVGDLSKFCLPTPRLMIQLPNMCLKKKKKNNAYVANYTLLTKAVITACNYHRPYLEKM